VLSSDGEHFAYAAQRGRHRWVMMQDGEPGQEFKDAGAPTFAPDGRRFAYEVLMIGSGSRRAVVVDGDVDAGGEGPVVFSDDGEHIAYRKKDDQGLHLVVDGQVGPGFEELGDRVLFRPQTGGVGYVAKSDDKWHPVLDGVAGPSFDEIHDDTLEFTADGDLVFVGTEDEGSSVVIDGVPAPDFGFVDHLVLSPDRRRLAYVAAARPRSAIDLRNRGSQCVVLDGEPGPELRSLRQGQTPDDWAISVAFTPDSAHLAYAAGSETGQQAFVDHEQGPVYERLSEPTFTDDGRPVFVGARAGTLYRLTWAPN